MKDVSGRFVRSAVSADDLLADGRPQIAIVGRSNVGKSSLLNRLLGNRKLARVSGDPGRTRAINYFLVDSRFYFVDLPGYGYAKVSKTMRRHWSKLVGSYLERALPGSLLVQLVDGKVGATPLDVEAHEYFRSLGAEPTVVATKIDRVGRGRRSSALAAIRRTLQLPEQIRLIPFSARTGEGSRELWGELSSFLQGQEGVS